MSSQAFEKFIAQVLKGQPAPDDLQKLFLMQAVRVANDDEYSDPLESIHAYLIAPEEELDLLTHSYLNDADKANPDIMANVKAIDKVFEHITFVAKTDDSDLIGYWHGPESTPIQLAPIVKYDTEGQFSLLLGKQLTEALLGEHVFDDDEEFTRLRDWFSTFGIDISASCWDDLDYPDVKTKPDELHHNLYNQHRVAVGLPPVE
jgi:hypothetical protein